MKELTADMAIEIETISEPTDPTDAPQHSDRFDGLPYGGDFADRNLVIFDGDCRFCTRSVRQLRWLDRKGERLAFLSLHDPLVAQWFPDLNHDQMMEQMFVVERTFDNRDDEQQQNADRKKHGGASAVRYLSRQLPLLWPVALPLHIPFSLPLWQALYRWVANRRYKIAGKLSDDQCEDSCKIHFDK